MRRELRSVSGEVFAHGAKRWRGVPELAVRMQVDESSNEDGAKCHLELISAPQTTSQPQI